MTITYIHRDIALASGIHVPVDVLDEFEQNLVTATLATIKSGALGGGVSGLLFVFTTPANEPNDAAWPIGDYRCQLDVNAVGAGITFGLRAAGTSTGHFARVDSGLTADQETKAQIESLFAGAGTHLATTGSVSWAAGSADERFECLIAGTRAASHGNQTLDLDVNISSSFSDGPWTAVAAAFPYHVFAELRRVLKQMRLTL